MVSYHRSQSQRCCNPKSRMRTPTSCTSQAKAAPNMQDHDGKRSGRSSNNRTLIIVLCKSRIKMLFRSMLTVLALSESINGKSYWVQYRYNAENYAHILCLFIHQHSRRNPSMFEVDTTPLCTQAMQMKSSQ